MSFKHGKAKDGSSLEPTDMPTTTDIAWAAGFFEGEGCAYNSGRGMAILVGQKDPETLFRLKRWFGGSIHKRNHSGAKKITLYAWMISGKRARTFVAAIWHFLSARRRVQVLKVQPNFLSKSVETERLPFQEVNRVNNPTIGSDVPVRTAQECAEANGNDSPRIN